MKKIIATSILFILIIMNVFNYAIVSAVSITEDELEEALEKVEQETGASDGQGFSMDKQKKEIEIKMDDASFIVKYDLSDGIKFTSDLSVTRDDMETRNDESFGYGMAGPMMMLMVVADNEGISNEDASAYIVSAMLNFIMGNLESGDISSSIDTDQFDILKEQIDKGFSIEDDLFTLSIEKVDETDDFIEAKCILTIPAEADFSVMEGAAEDLAGGIEGSLGDIMGNIGGGTSGGTESPVEQEKVNDTDEPTVDELLKTESKNEPPVTPKEDPTPSKTPNVAQKVIPKTGESDILLYSLLFATVVFAIISSVKLIKYNRKISK